MSQIEKQASCRHSGALPVLDFPPFFSLTVLSSKAPPNKLGGIFQMCCLITFAHSSPQQAEEHPAQFLFFMKEL
jgi:hypothetical protein